MQRLSRKIQQGARFLSFIPAIAWCLLAFDSTPRPAALPEVLSRMAQHERMHSSSLLRYTCLRRYTLNNIRFHKQAEVIVRMTYRQPGRKSFEVVSEKGPSLIRERVLHKMFEAEAEASSDEMRLHTQITPRNYNFELQGMEDCQGRPAYILKTHPKVIDKFMMQGRIWVDAEDFAIVRVEATPAKNPSVLIRNTMVVQQYSKHGPFWLPLSNRSETDSMLFGRTEVLVSSSGYEVTEAAAQ